jgi:hypothetical protein
LLSVSKRSIALNGLSTDNVSLRQHRNEDYLGVGGEEAEAFASSS